MTIARTIANLQDFILGEQRGKFELNTIIKRVQLDRLIDENENSRLFCYEISLISFYNPVYK